MGFKTNKVKLDFTSYPHFVFIGQRGIGKTTFFYDLVQKVYGSQEYGALISCGNENAYSHLDGLQVDDAKVWTKPYGFGEQDLPEEKWSRGFIEIVDAIIEGKELPKVKMVAIDTIDELYSIAKMQVFKEHEAEKNKKCKSLNEALGGYGAGKERVIDLIQQQIARLHDAGYAVFLFGHTKIKEKTDPITMNVYEVFTNNMPDGFYSAIADTAQMAVNIITEYEDYEEYKTKKTMDNKKEEYQVGRNLNEGKRYMYFRETGFINAKSRFRKIDTKTEFSVENFLDVFERAVKSQMNNEISDKEFKEEKEKEIKNNDEIMKIKRNEKKETNGEKLDSLKQLISKEIKRIKETNDSSKLESLKETLVKNGYAKLTDYKSEENSNKLEEILTSLSSI